MEMTYQWGLAACFDLFILQKLINNHFLMRVMTTIKSHLLVVLDDGFVHSATLPTLINTSVHMKASGASWGSLWFMSTTNGQNFHLLLYHLPKLIVCRLLCHVQAPGHKHSSAVTRKGGLEVLQGDSFRSRPVFFWRKDREDA